MFPSSDTKCYKASLLDEKLNFQDAIEKCISMNATLVEPRNQEENMNLATNVNVKSRYWIGISDRETEGTFKYVSDASEVGFTSWRIGQPNNKWPKLDCTAFKNGEWNTANCDTRGFPYICQMNISNGSGCDITCKFNAMKTKLEVCKHTVVEIQNVSLCYYFQELEAMLEDNNAKLGKNKVKLGDVEAKTDEHKTKLGEFVAKMEHIMERIDENKAKLVEVDAKLAFEAKLEVKMLQWKSIQTLNNTFQELEAKLDDNKAMINDNHAKIDKKGEEIQSNKAKLRENEAKISTNSDMLDKVNADVYQTRVKLDENGATLNATVTKVEGNIEKLTQHNVTINSNLDRLDKNEANIESNLQKLGELDAKISDNSETLNQNDAKIESFMEKLKKLLPCTSGYVKGEHGECLGKQKVARVLFIYLFLPTLFSNMFDYSL